MPPTSDKIRNIGIMAHIDAGKTTTTEHILYYSGVTHRLGEVDEGTTVMDWMQQEQDRGITITSAATTCYWREHAINIIDTPGHVDFTAEVERSLRVLDGGIAIFDAVNGVEAQSEKVWRQAEHYAVPCIIYINKMDRTGADFERTLQDIERRLGAQLAPINIPAGSEQSFRGIIDLIDMHYLEWEQQSYGKEYRIQPIPAAYHEESQRGREHLLDLLSKASEEITERYLQGAELSGELLRQTLRQECIARRLMPLCVGASLRNIGIQPLLDAIVAYLPAPEELTTIVTEQLNTKKQLLIERSSTPPLSALIFKITHDREAGDMSFVRLYSGTIRGGEKLYNSTKQLTERTTRLLKMHANHSAAVPSLKAGEIGVLIGMRRAQTGDTLCTTTAPHLLEQMLFPEPVLSMALEPQLLSDRGRLIKILEILGKEDPTFFWKDNVDTGELLISGMGELHLEVMVTRIINDWKLQVRAGKPQVEHRETIAGQYEQHERFEEQIAGERQQISFSCKVAPRPRGAGHHIGFQLREEQQRHRTLLQAAAEGALRSGISLGYPTVDIEVSISEVRYQESEMIVGALQAAVNSAIHRACQRATPIVLSPVMRVDILTPRECLGEMLAALNQREALIQGVESKVKSEQIIAEVALEKLFGFSTVVRSATRGLGEFSMEFVHYAENRNR